MKHITSPTNPLIKDLLKLYDKSERLKEKKFLVEGYHLVEEAYLAKVLETVFVIEESKRFSGVEVITVSNKVIEKLAKTKNPQGIIGLCKMTSDFELQGSKFLLVDKVSDPGNMGTIIRTALGFNIDAIIISPETVDIYNDKVIRSTQGAIFKIPIVEMDLIKAIEKLRKEDVYIIGTALNNSISLKELKKVNKYAIIVGNEAQGISPEVLKHTDINIKIEINPKLESLNVGIAAAIMMFYLGEVNV